MATETERLPVYWDGLKQLVFETGGMDDLTCFEVARKILQDCFRELKHEYPALVQWWFEKSVFLIRNTFFGTTASTALTNKDVIECGAEIKFSLCSDSKDPMAMFAHALRYLSLQNDAVSRLAHASIVGVSPDNFAKILDKKLNVLLQAAAVILNYVFHTPAARGCMLETIDDFRSRYADVIVDDGTTVIGHHVDPVEEANLFFSCNLIRIAQRFIPPGRAKGRYIDLATQLTERRTYSRGGGHTVFSERREKIFEIETGVIPIPRVRLAILDTDVTLTSENVVEIIARSAFQESSAVNVTVQRSETEYSIRNRPEKMVSIAQEMFFEGELVAQSLESRLMLSNGQQLTASLDVVTSDGDYAELEGVPLTFGTLKTVDIDRNEVYPLCAQSSNSTNRSMLTTSSGSRRFSMRSTGNDVLFQDLEAVLPAARVRRYQIMNYGLSGDGTRIVSTEEGDNNAGMRRRRSDLSDIENDREYYGIKRRNVGGTWEIVQQMDPDVVDMIPNEDVRQLFTNTRSMNAFYSTIPAPTASNVDFPPAAYSDNVFSYVEQPFAFQVVHPRAIQDTLFSSEASRSDPLVVFDPEEVFDMVSSSCTELDTMKLADSTN
jgi:hypothetical protein